MGGPSPGAARRQRSFASGERSDTPKGCYTRREMRCRAAAHLALGEGEKLESLCWELSNWHLLLLCPSSPF